MKHILLFLFLSFSFSASFAENEEKQPEKPKNISSLESLLEQVKQTGLQQSLINKEREQEFLKSKNNQEALLRKAKQKLAQVKKETARLKDTYDDNEEDLADLEEDLRKSMGNLGEMFGVVRQVAQDQNSIRVASSLSIFLGQTNPVLDKLAQSKALPDIKELEQLWIEMQSHMTTQGQIRTSEQPVVNQQGQAVSTEVYNIGPFVTFTEDGFLKFDEQTGSLIELKKQPDGSSAASDFVYDDGQVAMLIDPTRGTLMSLDSESPGIMDRINQGGFVGYVILTIAVLGLLYAAYLLFQYINTQKQVDDQLANPGTLSLENPLGRVLAVYDQQKDIKDVEALEMQLDEAVLKEMPKLEQGLPLIKLLAAVAPLLGLLGTVTGMIATFQSITLFGTGDPKLMAGGISQALITTVLGLVTAIPLLFMHNILSTRSKSLIQILDQQSAGIIAQQAQKDS